MPPLAVIDFAMFAVEWSVFTVDGRAVRDLKLGVLCPVDVLYILRIRKTFIFGDIVYNRKREWYTCMDRHACV